MVERELIAERTIYAIDKDLREFKIRLMIGKPYPDDSGSWACPVAMIGLRGAFPDMHDVDSWQALMIAVNLHRRLLTYFVEDGGKLFWDKDGNELTVEELLGESHEVPEPIGPLTEEQQERLDRLTENELRTIDDSLMADASTQWRKVARIVGSAMTANEEAIEKVSDIFYVLRLRKLVDEGRLIS
ncbi:MAG: DUF3658 domain-containing protein [Acidobacteriota bacterium]